MHVDLGRAVKLPPEQAGSIGLEGGEAAVTGDRGIAARTIGCNALAAAGDHVAGDPDPIALLHRALAHRYRPRRSRREAHHPNHSPE